MSNDEVAESAVIENSARRPRRNAQQSRDLILDAVERLLLRAGFGAVNTRTAAIEAGMKPPLVHYHFATTENLLLEAYRRSAVRSEASLHEALASDLPIHALWNYHSGPSRAALAAQYMALAGQHAGIREEMARNVERSRNAQVTLLEKALGDMSKPHMPSGAAIAMFVAACGRAVAMEHAIGVSTAHAEMIREMERLLEELEPTHAAAASTAQS